MEAPRDLVGRLVEFSPRMEDGEYDFEGRLSVLLHPVDRNSPPVVLHRNGTVLVDRHRDAGAVPGKGFIDRVVHHFIHEMVEPSRIGTPDIHGRSFPYRLQAFKYGDMRCVIRLGQSLTSP